MATTEQKISALQQAVAVSPEYAAITPLFIAVYEYLCGREDQTGISITHPGINRAERGVNGFPLLTPADLLIEQGTLTSFLKGVITVIGQQSREGDDALNRIDSALTNGAIDPEPLLFALLERRRAPLDDASLLLGVPSPLLEYIFEIPLKTALERYSADFGDDSFPGWSESICPVCGSRPAMAELFTEEGRRRLFCSSCSFVWPYKRMKCPSCGCEEAEKLSYFTAGDGAVRVDTCKACSRYIKTRDSRKANNDVPLEIEDLLTIHLDLMASREGFERGK